VRLQGVPEKVALGAVGEILRGYDLADLAIHAGWDSELDWDSVSLGIRGRDLEVGCVGAVAPGWPVPVVALVLLTFGTYVEIYHMVACVSSGNPRVVWESPHPPIVPPTPFDFVSTVDAEARVYVYCPQTPYTRTRHYKIQVYTTTTLRSTGVRYTVHEREERNKREPAPCRIKTRGRFGREAYTPTPWGELRFPSRTPRARR